MASLNFLTVPFVLWIALTSAKGENSVVPYAFNAIINDHFASPNANQQGKVNISGLARKRQKLWR